MLGQSIRHFELGNLIHEQTLTLLYASFLGVELPHLELAILGSTVSTFAGAGGTLVTRSHPLFLTYSPCGGLCGSRIVGANRFYTASLLIPSLMLLTNPQCDNLPSTPTPASAPMSHPSPTRLACLAMSAPLVPTPQKHYSI